jgi:hypothetical protein
VARCAIENATGPNEGTAIATRMLQQLAALAAERRRSKSLLHGVG